MRKPAILLMLFLSLAFAANSQPYSFKHYQGDNGLSNHSVICALQDNKGFLWFGTKDGLDRFDGYKFKVYRNDENDPGSLGNNLIHTLYLDKSGVMWVGTDKGIYRYDDQTESFRVLKTAAYGEILNIQEDHNGNLWYIENKHLFELQKKNKVVMAYSPDGALITSLCMTPGGKIWVSSATGKIYEYRALSHDFKSYDVFAHSAHAHSNWIVKLYDLNEDTLLIGTINQGVKRFNISAHTYQDILTGNPDGTDIFARDIMSPKKDEYWIATESGIYIYNAVNGTYTHLRKQYNDPYSLSDNVIYCLFKDKQGIIWAGTYFSGINAYSAQYSLFKKYFPEYGSNSLSGNVVKRICRDSRGQLWIGTEDGGLNKLNVKTGIFEHFIPTGHKGDLAYYNIHGLLAMGDHLWIGTYEHGLDIMDISSGKIIRHYESGPGENSLKDNYITNIYKTASGDIYVGTITGLYLYRQKTDDFSRVISECIKTVFQDADGVIWTGTVAGGAYAIDSQSRRTVRYTNTPAKNSLSSNGVNDIFQDSNRKLWFATENGLCRFDKTSRTFRRYGIGDGLPGNVTLSMLEDDQKNLWISTTSGLVAMNLNNGRMKTYTVANGLISDEFNYDSSLKDSDGTLYFGSLKGLVSFDPAKLAADHFAAPVYITGFQVNNAELPVGSQGSPLLRSTLLTDRIDLRHTQSSFSIDFAALNFISPEMSRYSYKMGGIDKDWIYINANRRIYFTNLSPGTYVFQVRTANSDGQWASKPKTLTIEIAPPFWASVYAWFAYALLLVLIIWLALRRYQQRSNERIGRKLESFENEKEREIYQAKIEFFTHITHEIRTPLTLMKGPLENIMRETSDGAATKKDLILVERNTDRLISLTNQLLDFRKAENQSFKLNFVKVNISTLVEDTAANFNFLAEQKAMSIKLNLPMIPVLADVDIEAMQKILNNLFTNAIKYAESILILKLNVNEENVIIDLLNDGHLIPAELSEKIFEPFYRISDTKTQQGNGIGLALSRSLAQLHNGTLEFLIHDLEFNHFRLSLPIHQQGSFHFENNFCPDQPENQRDPAKPLVMIVEDHPEISEFIAQTLSAQYSTITAANGRNALKLLATESVQLILSDIMMPVMDGVELCSEVKSNVNFSHIPVVLLTAKNALQSKIEGLASGADAYIEKPFSPAHLLVQIANLLKNRNTIKAYFAQSPLVHIKSIAYSKADEQFLETLNNAILLHMAEVELDVDQLAAIMNMSRPTLYRKIKAISDLTPNELINLARLKRAAELLAEGELKIYEISLMTGFSSQTYFGHNFYKQFGMTPSEYVSSKRLEKETAKQSDA